MEIIFVTCVFLISLFCTYNCEILKKNCPKHCHCFNSAASCVNKTLTYIPKFPSDIRHLTFCGNNLMELTPRTFENITHCHIEKLVLMNNNVGSIEKKSFRKLIHLKHLDLSYNDFNSTSLFNLMNDLEHLKRIDNLRLKNIGIENEIPTGLFKGLNQTNLLKLDLSENKLEHLNFTELKPLSHLFSFVVRGNKITSITMDRLERLEEFSLQQNNLPKLPNFCESGFVSFPMLEKLILDTNNIQIYVPEYLKCLQNLISLNLNSNSLRVIVPNAFTELKSLQELCLFNQQRPFKIRNYAFNHSNLRKIDINSNSMEIEYIEERAFEGCVNLTFLQLSANHLSDHGKEGCEHLNTILTPLISIQRLMLSYGSLHSIPSVLSNMPTLQQVTLYNNKIESWPDGFWDKTQLFGLDIEYNVLETISQEMLGPSIQQRMRTFKIGHNPLRCNCELVWLIEWIHKKPKVFPDKPHGYHCLDLTKRICLVNESAFQSIIAVCIILIVVCALTSIVYKYRWTIKYQLYIWRHPPLDRGNNFVYDFFVCYSVDDEDWVWEELQPKLEGDENIKLCIHQRDFQGGKLIVDNIVESMKSSRKVLIILSNSFAKSSWCQFELTVAHNLVLDSYLEPPTIILLEDIKTEYLSNTLNALINNTTYIPWHSHTDDSSEFWQRLKQFHIFGNRRAETNTEDCVAEDWNHLNDTFTLLTTTESD